MSARVTAVRPAWAIEGGRDRHRRHRLSGRSAAAARRARSAALRARRVRVADGASASSCPPALEGGQAADRASTDADGDGRLSSSVAGAFATGLHQVDNPVVRSRRQSLRHLQRHARTAGAGVDLPRAAERHARDRSRRASSTPRRWRSMPEGRLYVSSRFEGAVYRVDGDGTAEPFAHRSRRRVRSGVRGRTGRCSSATGPARSSASTPTGSADGVRDAAAERRGVSPRDRPGRRALRHGADALGVRRGLPGRARRHGDARLTTRFGRPQGLAFDAAGARCSSSKRWRARAGCTGCGRRQPPELRPRGTAVWSASRSIRAAAWSSARTTRPTASCGEPSRPT